MLQIAIEFSLLALGLGLAGFYLTLYGDVIAEKTGLGGTWIGLAMIATVTSLPELVTGFSAVHRVNAPDIALGDSLGSCVFNLLLIVMLDFMHREGSVYTRLSQGHILSAGFTIMLLGLVAFNILLYGQNTPLALGHIGLATPIIFLFYLVAIYSVFQYERKNMKEQTGALAERYPTIGLSKALLVYSLAAITVVAIGLRLPVTAVQLAAIMNWDRTFVGTLFVALATSLPEVAVTLSSVRIGALDLAMSGLFGSNLFDLFTIAINDLIYLRGPLLASVSSSHLITIQTAIMMSGIAIVGLLYRPRNRVLKTVGWASLLILMLFVLNVAVHYLNQVR